ncbi:hypothetical protein GcC1_104019, partial [Golovinomyces cichoracearum]
NGNLISGLARRPVSLSRHRFAQFDTLVCYSQELVRKTNPQILSHRLALYSALMGEEEGEENDNNDAG